jgi:hypothetical protein
MLEASRRIEGPAQAKGPSRIPMTDYRLSPERLLDKKGTPSGSQTTEEENTCQNEPRWGDRTFESLEETQQTNR